MSILILYIEDDPSNALLTKRILELRGWKVETAATGLEGLRKAYELKPDAILLDINLPDISGYQVAEHLRASPDPAIAAVAIIAVTAYALAGDAAKVLSSGCDGYISKPFDIQDMITRVERFLRLTRGTGALHMPNIQ